MKSSKVKDALGKVFHKNTGNAIVSFFVKYKRYFGAAAVFAVIILILVNFTDGTAADKDPMSGVYQTFEEDSNKELNSLIKEYYKDYAAGDVDAIKKIASPVSDAEASYIQFFSQYVDEYQNLKVYSKRGLDKKSYLVSVYLEMKFKDIDTPAAGLDFFYVSTNKEGKLYINNLYSSFNQANGENEMDPEVTSLIAAYEQQDDILALQAEVQQKCNEAMTSDNNLNTFVTSTLQDAISKWATDYKASVEQAKADAAAQEEADKKAQEEADKKAQEEAEQKAQEEAEEANKTTVYTTDKVNVRDSASEDGNKLGTVDKGTQLTRYADENGWSKIDYNGTKAYVKSDFLTEQQDDTTAENTDNADNTDTENTVAYDQGEKITLTNTVNVRASMSESASKVAVAYAGETVTVKMSYAEGWTKVSYGNKEGYVKSEYLK